MKPAGPPIIPTVLMSWRDGLHALRDMPMVTIDAYAISVCVAVANLFLDEPADKRLSIGLLSLGVSILQVFLLAPVAIAIHRYVLLGEITNRYRLEPRDQRFKDFFAYGALIQLMFEVPVLLIGTVNIGTILVWLGGAVFVAVRTLVLFPAIAVRARNTNWWNAMRDSKGHFWRTFVIVIVVGLPPLLLLTPVVMLTQKPVSLPITILLVLLEAAVAVAMLAAYAALASHLFRAWAFRLGQPAVDLG
jgi:hypothetical protein